MEEKSREEYLKQMMDGLKQSKNTEFMTEIAMPGVHQNVKDSDWQGPDSSE